MSFHAAGNIICKCIILARGTWEESLGLILWTHAFFLVECNPREARMRKKGWIETKNHITEFQLSRKFKKLLTYEEHLRKSFGGKKGNEPLYWLLSVSCFSSLVCPWVNCPICPPDSCWDCIQPSELLWFLPWGEWWRPCQKLAFSPHDLQERLR